MIECYNFSTLKIKQLKADSVAIKGVNAETMLFDLVNGEVSINTDNWTIGEYAIQYFKENQVIKTDKILCKQNLKYASTGFDPRSEARIILEAIDAVLMGRATSGQDFVKIGEKQLHYMSFDQLKKWRDFYAIEARKQEGKAGVLRFQKMSYKGI